MVGVVKGLNGPTYFFFTQWVRVSLPQRCLYNKCVPKSTQPTAPVSDHYDLRFMRMVFQMYSLLMAEETGNFFA